MQSEDPSLTPRATLPAGRPPAAGAGAALHGATMSFPSERPEDCPSRIGLAAGGGFVAGSLFGAVASNWGDIPVVLRDKPWPALVRTGSVMAQYGSTLALVGAAFAAADVRRGRRPCLWGRWAGWWALHLVPSSWASAACAAVPSGCADAVGAHSWPASPPSRVLFSGSALRRPSVARRTGSTAPLVARQQGLWWACAVRSRGPALCCCDWGVPPRWPACLAVLGFRRAEVGLYTPWPMACS